MLSKMYLRATVHSVDLSQRSVLTVMTEIRNSVILDPNDPVISCYDDRHKKNVDGL